MYSSQIAHHYAAYRPLLHKEILKLCLPNSPQFQKGLDIGCGTGYSAVALAAYCAEVYAVEPSEDMLAHALPHPAIQYFPYAADHLPFPKHSFDVVTFGGSLVYIKSNALLDTLRKICMPNAILLVYDFEVILDEWYEKLGISVHSTEAPYDHELNFSGLNLRDIHLKDQGSEQAKFQVNHQDLGHLLLSSAPHYQAFAEKYQQHDPFPQLINNIAEGSLDSQHSLGVNLFFTIYEYEGV